METLWMIVFFILLGVLVGLCIKFGIVNIDPQHIVIRRNVITGALKELKPGLRFFIPGLYENFRLVDCRQVIIDPKPLTVTSRDGQPVDVDYQITLWVDGFDEKGEIKKGQAIKTATKIGEQKEILAKVGVEASQEKFKKDLETMGLKESNVSIQNMIGNYLMGELVGEKLPLAISCPFCGREIKGGEKPETECSNPDCEMKKKGMKVPAGFYERLSFSSGIRLHNDLGERYGLGCFLKIRNALYPADVERAARAERIAEMEGRATKARFDKETEAFKNLINETGVDPNVAFLGGKLIEAIPEVVAALKGEKRKTEKTEGREKK